MKILQVGDFRFDFYDQSLFLEFSKKENIELDKFVISDYFLEYEYPSITEKIFYSFQNRYKFGPVIKKINDELIRAVKENKYDIVFLWRAVHIYPSTIKELKKYSCIIGYNNDQTFSSHHPWWLFYLLKKSIPFYDHFYVYRESDLESVKKVEVSSSVFMPTFDKDKIYPIETIDKKYDVAFIGHYEDDGRDELILKLIKEGLNVRLNGQRWDKSKHHEEIKSYLGDILPVYDQYNEALNSSKVCLSFLSKLNNDTYTRRTVEIPATRTVMLAEYTKQQAAMFSDNVEAVYFHDHSDAINKLKILIEDDDLRNKIAENGYKKVLNGSYQLKDRVLDIINVAKSIS